MGAPLVTVGIASYNHAAYLGQAIDSVLTQTAQDFEIVIVDDASSDDSVGVAREYARRDARVRLLTHPNGEHRGIAATTNLSLSGAGGKFLTWIDSDDLWMPETLERRLALMESRPNAGMMCSFHQKVDGLGSVLAGTCGVDLGADWGNRLVLMFRLLLRDEIAAPTVMIRRECFDKVGPFDDLDYCDWEMWLRIAACGEIAFLPEVLAKYRRHNGSFTSNVRIVDDIARRMAVTVALSSKTERLGGLLLHPFIRCMIRLQMCCYLFHLGRREEALRELEAGLNECPGFFHDGGALFGQWLSMNPIVQVLKKPFPAWVLAQRCVRERKPPSLGVAVLAER